MSIASRRRAIMGINRGSYQYAPNTIELFDFQIFASPPGPAPTGAIIHGDTISGGMLTQYGAYAFMNHVSIPKLSIVDPIETICAYAAYYSALITDVSFPECTYIGKSAFEAGGATTYQCVTNVYLPKVTVLYGDTFRYQKNITSVQIGSVGYPVTSVDSNAFRDCTQSGLTITLYVADDATLPLTGSPFGATNATIVYKSATTGEVLA